MDFQTILEWILAILLVATAYWYLTVPKNLPPGITGVPILGCLPFISLDGRSVFDKLEKKYGNIYHLYFGSQLAIVLADFAAIKEAFVKQADVFAGRPLDPEIDEADGQKYGIVFCNGEYGRQHRKFIFRIFANLGVGKTSIEPLLLDEIDHFMKVIRQQNGAEIDLQKHLNLSICNNIMILVTGKRFDYDHPTLIKINGAIRKSLEILFMPPLKLLFPWAKFIIDKMHNPRKNALKNFYTAMDGFINEVTAEEKSKTADGQSNNYIHAYLTEKNNRMKSNGTDNIFNESGLNPIIRDLLVAGTETSASTLAWAALYMAVHPDVQKRVQREIDDVIGRHREPSYADRINTPYTEATINELHRVISLGANGLPHRCTKDTTVLGYKIPKDTAVSANYYAVHHDVRLWGDPENFRPERFIGPKGECLRPEYLIPFGIGKRACTGEILAKMEVYLYFVSLLQHFNFVPPEGVKLTLEAKTPAIREAVSRLICVKPRS